MRNLIEFLQQYAHWFLFLVLEVVSGVLFFENNRYQSSAFFTTANAIAAEVHEVQAKVDAFFNLSALNAQLTQRNVALEIEVETLKGKLEKDSLVLIDSVSSHQALLHHLRTIPAKVVQNSVASLDNLITINKGTADGVTSDMGVASGNGIVGIVYLSSSHYSVVIPLLNLRSSISCRIDTTGYFGYLKWDGKSPEIAYLDDVPRHAKFRNGDAIVTSGYSSVFPAGLMVGRIAGKQDSSNGMSYCLKIKLSTNFGNLRDVIVVGDETAKERLRLLQAAQDSLKQQQNQTTSQ